MTENQKRIAIVVVVLIVALLLFMRGGNANAGNTVVNNGGLVEFGDVASPNLSAPSFTFNPREPFVLPDFGTNPNNLSAIGACCADCSPRTATPSYRAPTPGITFITNRGNSGPNVFVYQQPVSPAPKPIPVTFFHDGRNNNPSRSW